MPLLLALACASIETAIPAEPPPPPPVSEPGPATLDGLLPRLDAEARRAAASPTIIAEYATFAASHDLRTDDAARLDYARVRLVFEATREGGWWWLDWAITDAEPQSDAIWTRWRAVHAEPASAIAECDETSALFSFLVRRLGVRDAGLIWPRSDHTVAVWMTKSRGGAPVRLIVPTSQVLIGPRESLATTAFDPWRQKRVYPYERADAKGDTPISPALSGFFVRQAERYAAASTEVQTNLRVLRDDLLDGGSDAAALTRARDLTRGDGAYAAFEAELADWGAVRAR